MNRRTDTYHAISPCVIPCFSVQYIVEFHALKANFNADIIYQVTDNNLESCVYF